MVQKQEILRTAAPEEGGAGRLRAASLPERSCVVCRASLPAPQLLRLSCMEGVLLFARGGKARGRGAYVCPEASCLRSLNSARLSRALRSGVSLTETNEEALERLRALAKRRILETLGLARRSGMLEMGSDRVAENLKTCMDMGESGVALRASDLSDRTAHSLRRAWVLGTSEDLGRAIGVARAGALWVSASRFAVGLDFWLRVERASCSAPDPAVISDDLKVNS